MKMTGSLFAATAMLTLVLSAPAMAQFRDIYRINNGTADAHVEYKKVDLAPGKELLLADLAGPGKITYFYYTDSGASDGTMYPGLVLLIYWDDATQPSVRVPLWNFFGAFGSKSIDYQSLLMQINHYCYMSYLPMPFSKRARLVLLNDGDKTYSQAVAYGVDYERNPEFEQEGSRLHAAWTRSNPVRNGEHPMLEIMGKGQYIGNFLQVNTHSEGWWGEGETIFQVDGKKFVHSAGTEDEYGSTWGFEHTFSYPYSGYLQMDEDKNRMYRWYFANPVRFQKSLRVVIQNERITGQFPTFEEALAHRAPSDDDYTSVSYWYQEGAHPAPMLPPYTERIAASKIQPQAAKPEAARAPAVEFKTVVIDNTNPRRDSAGNILDAHDGCLKLFNGKYYLYGTRYGKADGWGKTNKYGVYSSPNLKDWTDEGVILNDLPEKPYYRPYVVYNGNTHKYVLWYNDDGRMGVATADRPEGPFTEQSSDVPLKHRDTGDLGLFVDNDGTGYVTYSYDDGGDYKKTFPISKEPIPHHQIVVEQLTADYLGSTGRVTQPIAGNSEAPTLFRRGDLYYLLFDNTCAICSSGTGVRVYIAQAPLGPYLYKGNINREGAQSRDRPSPWTEPGTGRKGRPH